MNLGREIIRLERARSKLLSVDPNDKKKLLAASRKVDRLVVGYYRSKKFNEDVKIYNIERMNSNAGGG